MAPVGFAANDPEAALALRCLLRLVAADLGGPDALAEELNRALAEICDVAGDPAVLSRRLAWILHLAAGIGAGFAAVLARPEGISPAVDEQDAIRRIELAIEQVLAGGAIA